MPNSEAKLNTLRYMRKVVQDNAYNESQDYAKATVSFVLRTCADDIHTEP